MAIQNYRFRKVEPGVDEDQLRLETDATATVGSSSTGQVLDVQIEETLLDDLIESMASRGYVQVGGVNPPGTPGDDAEFVRRSGDTMTGDLVVDGATANVSLTNNARVTGVLDVPVAPTDAVNANYVQAVINSRDPKESSRLCTGGVDIVGAGWTPAGSGVGKTLTSPTNATSNNDFDGVTAVVGDRVLVKDGAGANAVSNGIYEVTQLADGAANPAILTRAADFDEDAEVTQGAFTFVVEGTTCASIGFILITADPITVDTTQMTFTEISAADLVIAGAGLDRTANTLSVDLDAAADAQGVGTGGGSSGLEFDAAGDSGQLRVKVDPSGGIQRSGNGLQLELDPAGAIVTGANGVAANVDGVTIQIVGNELTAVSASDGAAQLMFGTGRINGGTSSRFLFPGYDDGNALNDPSQFRISRAGTIQNLRVRHNDPRGNGNAIVYTLRVNGTPTALSASLNSTASDGSDLTNQIVVAAGDLIDIIVTKAASVGSAPRQIVATLEFTV